MKNLKKVLALVLALGMILSTFTALTTVSADEADTTAEEEAVVETAEETAEEAEEAEEVVAISADSAYSFSDVEGTEYAEAAEVLNALGIAEGYEDGTFGGDKTVTRAEMAAFIVREIGLGTAAESAAANTTSFSDVAATHWATGSINIANEKNIINGLGDGRFAPGKTVEYQAAVKMLVCALGYNVVATRNGGWPQGYIIAGAQIGLTDGITGVAGTDGCSRGIVAQLLYNALEIGLMEETVYAGSAVQIEKVCQTLLYDKLGVIKLYDADIVGTATQGTKQNEGFARISGYKNYWNNNAEYVKYPTIQNIVGKVNGLNVDKFFGDSVIVYYKDNGENKNPTLLCILEDKVRQETFELDIADLYSNNSVVAPGDLTYEDKTNTHDYTRIYYKTENDSKAKYVKVSYYDTPYVVINGNNNAPFDEAWIESLENGTIKFIDAEDENGDPNPDGIYEKLIFTTYWDYVVKEVDADDGEVITKNDDIEITLDESKIYTIVDTEGNELKVADLNENDVLSIYPDSVYDDNDINNAEVLKVVVSNNTVEGVVTEITAKGLYIDDEFYKTDKKDSTDPDDHSIVDVTDFTLGEEGTFYLNAEGLIVYAETTTAANDYALVYDVFVDSAKKATISVLTSEGEEVELTVQNSAEVIEFALDSSNNYAKSITKYGYNKALTMADLGVKLDPSAQTGTYAPYIIGYDLKSGSETQIDKIYYADAGISSASGKLTTRFGIWKTVAKDTYYTATKLLAGCVVDSSTVIFDIPTTVASSDDIDDIKIITPKNEDEFTNITVYEMDKNKVAKAMTVSTVASKIDLKDTISIIRNITTVTNADGDTVYKLYMLKNGKEVVKITEDLDVIDDYGTGTVEELYTQESLAIGYDFYPGAAIFYKEASDGSISDVEKIYPVPTKNAPVYDADNVEIPYYLVDYFTTWQNSRDMKYYSDNCECLIVYGKVTEKNSKNNLLTIETKAHDGTYGSDNLPNIVADSKTVNYSTANVTVVDYNLDDVNEQIASGSLQDVKVGSYVLVRTYNSVCKDIVVYKNFSPENAKVRF